MLLAQNQAEIWPSLLKLLLWTKGESKYALGPLYLWQCLFSYFIHHYFLNINRVARHVDCFFFITCLCENTSKRLQGTCLIFFHVCFFKTHVRGAKKVNVMYHMSYIIISTNLNFSGTGRRVLSTLLSVGVSFSKLQLLCFRLYAASPELLTAIYYSFVSKLSLI